MHKSWIRNHESHEIRDLSSAQIGMFESTLHDRVLSSQGLARGHRKRP